MNASRRSVLIGGAFLPSLAISSVASLARWLAPQSASVAIIYDANLRAGKALAATIDSAQPNVYPIRGDRVRLAFKALTAGPQRIFGVSRPSDALIIQDVVREAGYRIKSEFAVIDDRCTFSICDSDGRWQKRIFQTSDQFWPQIFESEINGSSPVDQTQEPAVPLDAGLVLGWALTRNSAAF